MMASPVHTDILNLLALDTGCIQYLSNMKQDFINMRPYTEGVIQRIGESTFQPKTVGTVKIGCNIRGGSVVILLSDTLFWPGAGINLMSVSQLMLKRGVNSTFHPTIARIQTPECTFLANIYCGLYLLDFWYNQLRNNTKHASYSIMNPTLQLWNERIGHFEEQNVKRLQEMLTGMIKPNNNHSCKDCILGRMKEKPYNKPSPCGEYSLKYIHTNITDPFPVVGYNRCQY